MLINYLTIVDKLFNELDSLLNNYVFNSYTALSHYLKIPLALAIVLYIVMFGLAITQGWVRLSTNNLVKSSLKLAFIYIAAMNWGWFSHIFMGLLNTAASQIGDVLVNATPIPMPHFAGTGINGAMQSVLIEFSEIGKWVWDRGSFYNLAAYFSAILIWGFGFALILVALFELILAKIMLAILLAMAPLFIAFTLFKPTHNFFDRWLGTCVGFSLMMIFVASILALALSLAQWSVAAIYANHAARLSIVGFIPTMIVGFIGVGLVLRAAHLALAIGGTVSTLSGSTLLAETLGGAVGASLATKTMLGGGKFGNQSTTAAVRAIRHDLMKAGYNK